MTTAAQSTHTWRFDRPTLLGVLLTALLIAAAGYCTGEMRWAGALMGAVAFVLFVLASNIPLQMFLLTAGVLASLNYTVGGARFNVPGDLMAMALLAAAFFRWYLGGRREPLVSGNLTLLIPLLLIIFYGCLSSLWAVEGSAQFRQLIIWVWLAIFLIGLSNIVRRREAVRAVLWATLLLGAIEAFGALAVFAGREAEATEQTRLNLTFAHPLGGLVVLAWLLYSPTAHDPAKKHLRWGAYLLVGIIVAGLLVNHKKSALAAFPLPCLLVIWRAIRPTRFHRTVAKLVVLPLILAAATYVTFPRVSREHVQRLARTAAGQHLSASTRLQLWRMSIDIWKDHPWLGLGFSGENLTARYHRYFHHDDYFVFDPPFMPHNMYLFFLATTGVVGFSIWASLIALAYRLILKLDPDHPASGWVRAALLGLWTCFLTYHLFDPFNNIRRPYFVILLAVIGASVKLFPRRRNAVGRRKGEGLWKAC